MGSARGIVITVLLSLGACTEHPIQDPPSAVRDEAPANSSTTPPATGSSSPSSAAGSGKDKAPVAEENHAYVEGTQSDGTEGGLALRSGPSANDKIVLVIPEGSRVRVTGAVMGDFTPISYAGHDGWAHSEFLDLIDRGGTTVDVPWIEQNPELPRGCEVTSLAMLLRHAGIGVDKMTLATQVDKVPYESNGLRGNPNDGFVGDMYTFAKPGYGVYHAPIRRLAEGYLPNHIVDLTGKSFDDLLGQHLAQGRPIWVIANAKFHALDSSAFETWKTSSGNVRITWEEHSVVIVGYDSHSIFINNPLDSNGKNKRIERQAFRAAWEQMGSQAITYLP